jgi:hypothetical protein
MLELLNKLQELILSLAVEDTDLFMQRIVTNQEYKELIAQIKELSTKYGGADITPMIFIICTEAILNAK